MKRQSSSSCDVTYYMINYTFFSPHRFDIIFSKSLHLNVGHWKFVLLITQEGCSKIGCWKLYIALNMRKKQEKILFTKYYINNYLSTYFWAHWCTGIIWSRVYKAPSLWKSRSCQLQLLMDSHLHFLSVLEFVYRASTSPTARSFVLSRAVILQYSSTHPKPRLSDTSSSRLTEGRLGK